MKILEASANLINDLREYDAAIEQNDYLNKLIRNSDSFLLLDKEDKFVGAAGICQIWEGMGEAWLIASDRVKQNGLVFARAVRRGLLSIINTRNYHRVQTTVDNSFPEAIRFIEFLGFQKEGLMKAYSADKKDYWMYSKGAD